MKPQNNNYFVFVFVQNYPPICVGQFSAYTPHKATEKARENMSESPKYSFLLPLGVKMQVAKAVR